MAWGYTVQEWNEESPVNQAQAVAHYLVRSIREAYVTEQSMNKDKGKGSSLKSKDGVKGLMGRFGL